MRIFIFSERIDVNTEKMFRASRYGYHAVYISQERKGDRQRKKTENATKSIMHSGIRASHEKTMLMFAGGTVSHVMCPSDGQKKDDKIGQAGGKAR